ERGVAHERVAGADVEINVRQRLDTEIVLLCVRLDLRGEFEEGASQFLQGSPKVACGKSKCQRLLRQNVSKHINPSSPWVLQNWPGLLKRHWYCRQVDSIGPLPRGSPRFAPWP